MSIRPVDLQVMLPRASEVNRTNNLENGRPEAQQQQFAQQLQKQTQMEQQQVIQTHKSEKQAVDRDAPRKDGKEKDKKQKRGKGDGKDSSPYEDRGMIDIRI